ncbi:MAG: hypothetical protein ACI4JF_03885 [Oscillospiraceae bacterium]
MNKSEAFSLLKKLYGGADVPTAVISGGEIWENPAFAKGFAFMSRGEREGFIKDTADKGGTGCTIINNTAYTYSTFGTSEASVLEITGSEPLKRLFALPEVRSYFKYVFSRLRSSVNSVSVAADELYAALSSDKISDGAFIADRLNCIDGGISGIIGAILDPEQMILLTDGSLEAATVCIKDELEKILCSFGLIRLYAEDGLYARLSRSTLKVIIADVISKCLKSGCKEEKISVSAQGGGIIKVSICAEGADVSFDSAEDLFFSYMCDVFCGESACSCTRRSVGGRFEFILEFPSVDMDKIQVFANTPFKHTAGRFDPVTIRMTEIRGSERYIPFNGK